jgi:hypothetical protein
MMMKKNETYKEIKVKDITLKFFYNPYFFHFNELNKIYKDIDLIHQQSLRNYKFGIFRGQEEFKELSKNMMISIFYKNNKPIGFFYNIYQNKDNIIIVYQGTFLTSEKTEIDILNIVGPLNAMFLFEKMGACYLAAVTQVPSVVEALTENSKYSWPNPENTKFASRKIKDVYSFAKENFEKFFLEDDEKVEYNDKLFICRISSSNEKKYFNSIKQTSLSKNLKYNLFLNFLLDYEKNDFLFLISYYNTNCQKKNKYKIAGLINYLSK